MMCSVILGTGKISLINGYFGDMHGKGIFLLGGGKNLHGRAKMWSKNLTKVCNLLSIGRFALPCGFVIKEHQATTCKEDNQKLYRGPNENKLSLLFLRWDEICGRHVLILDLGRVSLLPWERNWRRQSQIIWSLEDDQNNHFALLIINDLRQPSRQDPANIGSCQLCTRSIYISGWWQRLCSGLHRIQI